MARGNVAAQLENLDQRLVRVEQILPALATKEDLRVFATKEDLVATKEDLRRELQAAIAPLATKEELRRAIEPLATKAELHEVRDELRRHMDIGFEALRSDIELLAEHVVRIAGKVYGE
jgi:hypothetical protein